MQSYWGARAASPLSTVEGGRGAPAHGLFAARERTPWRPRPSGAHLWPPQHQLASRRLLARACAAEIALCCGARPSATAALRARGTGCTPRRHAQPEARGRAAPRSRARHAQARVALSRRRVPAELRRSESARCAGTPPAHPCQRRRARAGAGRRRPAQAKTTKPSQKRARPHGHARAPRAARRAKCARTIAPETAASAMHARSMRARPGMRVFQRNLSSLLSVFVAQGPCQSIIGTDTGTPKTDLDEVDEVTSSSQR